MNPSCPNCKQIMVSKWRKTTVGDKKEGRAKFWVCKPCKIQFKIGAEVIRRKSKVKTEKEINDMLKSMQFQKTRERQGTPNVQFKPQ